MNPKKEYKVVAVTVADRDNLEDILDTYGDKGWSLVQILPAGGNFDTAVFSRDTGEYIK